MKGFLGRDVWWLVFHVRREQRWNSGLQLKQESHKFNSRRNSAAAVNWEQQTHWIFTCLEAGPGWEALLKPYGTGWMIKRKHNYMGECGNDFSQLKKKKKENLIPLHARWSNERATGTQRTNGVMTKRTGQWHVTQKDDKGLNKLTCTTIFICSLIHSTICTGCLLHDKYCSRHLNKT